MATIYSRQVERYNCRIGFKQKHLKCDFEIFISLQITEKRD